MKNSVEFSVTLYDKYLKGKPAFVFCQTPHLLQDALHAGLKDF
jgi:hypothetical protein